VGTFLEQKDSVFTMFIISYLDPEYSLSCLRSEQAHQIEDQASSAEALDPADTNVTGG